MVQQLEPTSRGRDRTPIWRRITAAFTLSSLVIVGGVALAALLAALALLALFILESAIAG
ncbi:MAG: hypothetical protein AAF467_06665 [Actinomycetota bacterium]